MEKKQSEGGRGIRPWETNSPDMASFENFFYFTQFTLSGQVPPRSKKNMEIFL